MARVIRRVRRTVTTETWTIVWSVDDAPPFWPADLLAAPPEPDRESALDGAETNAPSQVEDAPPSKSTAD